MKTPHIAPYNPEKRTKDYVEQFVREVKERFDEYPEYENNFLFYGCSEGIPKGEIVLILNPRMFYIPSTARRGSIITLADMLSPSDIVQEQVKCRGLANLRSTPAKYIGNSGLMYGGYLGESPWEACAGDCGFLCQDNKKRFMMNYDVGKGYVFLPHPDFLEEFLKGLEQIPKNRLGRGIIPQLREYYRKISD